MVSISNAISMPMLYFAVDGDLTGAESIICDTSVTAM